LKTEELKAIFDNIKKKALEISKVVGEDAVIGAQMGKHKVQELDLERQKLMKTMSLGTKALSLYKKGKLVQKDLNAICEQIIAMDKSIGKQKTAFAQQKRKLKKIPLK